MTRTKSIRYNAAQNEPLLIQSLTGDKSGTSFFEKCKGKRRSDYFLNQNPIVLELACGRWEYTTWLSQLYPDKNFIGVDVKGERMMLGIKSYKLLTSPQPLTPTERGSPQQESLVGIPLQARDERNGEGTRVRWIGVNIWFLRTIIHHLDRFFAPGEVDEIWIVHPDPRSKWHDARRRLTSPRFLNMYASILKPGGLLRLKTDDDGLFEYSKEIIENFSPLTPRSGEELSPTMNSSPNQQAPRSGEEFDNAKVFKLIDMTTDLHHSPLLADHHGIITHYEQIALDEWRTIKYAIWQKS